MILRNRPDFTKSNCGAAQVGLMLLSAGLSYLAGQLLGKKNNSPLDDDKPTTLSKRGSFINWKPGVWLVGPVFGWAGEREIRKEEAEGGKGGGGPEVDIYYESGWHQLGVGPCFALHSIVQGGEVIFEGPITSVSHPSGSVVDLGVEGSFTIYWGEETQPINTFLGDSERVGISSRWPFVCYIVWNKKRLSQSPTWPKLDYIVERRPTNHGELSDSDAWYDPTPTLDGDTALVVDNNASSDPDDGYIELSGDQSSLFDLGRIARLTGNTLPDGDYTVRDVEVVQVVTGAGWSGLPTYATRTRVFFDEATVGSDDNGSLQAYSFANDDGANLAHCIAELLYAPWPQGLGKEASGFEGWDLDSLEEMGVEFETNGWRSGLGGTNGETAESLLAGALQDAGTMLPIDTTTGLLKFQRVREPSGTIVNLSLIHI